MYTKNVLQRQDPYQILHINNNLIKKNIICIEWLYYSHAVSTSMIKPKINVQHTGVVPIIQGGHHKKVPPLMRMSDKVEFSCRPPFRNFCDIN